MAPQQKTAPKPDGIIFPLDAKGNRTSSTLGRECFSVALAAADPATAIACSNERNWRFGYQKHVHKATLVGAKSPEAALAVAQAGLTYMHERFEFARDGRIYSLTDAMERFTGTFETGVVRGTKPRSAIPQEVVVPYHGKQLKGAELIAKVEEWARAGTIEPTCAEHMKDCIAHPEWRDLSDSYFVLLGAGSAMGPFLTLAALGANIIAIDLNHAPTWKRLISTVQDSPATMTFCLDRPQSECTGDVLYEAAGCNLLNRTPEIKNWLISLYPDKQLVIGAYAYMDGEMHVRLAMGMDCLQSAVCAARKNTCLAYLNTPTNVYLAPESAHDQSQKSYNDHSVQNLLLTPMTYTKYGGVWNLQPAYHDNQKVEMADGKKYWAINSLVMVQGPNYALAKSVQHWRAVVARCNGHLVSSNVAPSTATVSVTHNRSIAMSYQGFRFLPPLEVFQAETSNAVMALLLFGDLRNSNSASNPKFPLANPLLLFTDGACHGGSWRTAFNMDTIGLATISMYAVHSVGEKCSKFTPQRLLNAWWASVDTCARLIGYHL